MRLLDAGFAAHIASGCTTLCWCWRVDRPDGVALGFTDHDLALSFDGVTFEATTGFTGSAIEDQLGLAVSNSEASGALSSDALSEADLSAGRYDGALITLYRVNWADVAERAIMRKGRLGQVTRGRTAFAAELRGMTAPLDQAVGRMLTRTCDWTHGDADCGRTLTPHAGTVTSVPSNFQLVASGLDAFASGFFTGGKLTWTSGANAGLSMDLTAHVLAGTDARLTLFLPMGAPVEVGDAFTVTEGCDNLYETCIAKDNTDNFGGFPHMPGNDFAVTYARRSDKNDGGRRT